MLLRISRIIEKTKVEGPGVRFCIFVQGCDIHCDGCANREMWDFGGGEPVDTDSINKRIYELRESIDGVTFLGGEPSCQAEAVSKIAEFTKSMGLTVILFSGHLYEELLSCGDKHILNLLKNTDLLIDGEYEKELTDYSRALVGSTNQRYLFLSEAINREDILNCINAFELRLMPNGIIAANGMGDFSKISELIKAISGEKAI